MTKTFKTASLMTLPTLLILFFIYSCNKHDTKLATEPDKEITLFVDKADKSNYKTKDLVLGGNVDKVTSIGYNHSVLNTLTSSDEWKSLLSSNKVNLEDIKRTYLHNTTLSLITIPILSDNKAKEYFNIYIHGEEFVITRLSEVKKEDGLSTYKVQSAQGDLYYQFDLNQYNQVGNWHFEKDLPRKFKKTSNTASSQVALVELEPAEGGCASKPFNECMNCLIIGICGSDWVCTIACGLAIPSCVGGAAAVCLIG